MNRARVVLVAFGALVCAAIASAASSPTLVADPTVIGRGASLRLSGTVPSASAGEAVRIEAKECNSTFFRVFGGANTASGGGWTYTQGWLRNNTTFRARWKDAVSAPVVVLQRAPVWLEKKPRGIVEVYVQAPEQTMAGRSVRLERLTPNGWVPLRRATLRKGSAGSAFARFKVETRGLRIRGAISDAAARPCYTAGVSTIGRS